MMEQRVAPEVVAKIAEAIRSIRFGTVQITIHNSHVVQIEKAEKIRFDHGTNPTTGGASRTIAGTDRTSGGPLSNAVAQD